VEGVPDIGTWVFALAGYHAVCCPCGHFGSTPVLDAGSVFDPFYSLPAAQLMLSTRDLVSSRTTTNPLGIIGTWLVIDGDIPTTDTVLFGTTPEARWARKIATYRVYSLNLALPGEDGLLNTRDDRILLSGGGSDSFFFPPGSEPAAPNCEIFLPPGVNDRAASP
jgi:hypothetical protein